MKTKSILIGLMTLLAGTTHAITDIPPGTTVTPEKSEGKTPPPKKQEQENQKPDPKKQTKNNGFTLIELMVVVAVIAIISSIGFPAYQEYVMKSRRSDAQSALLQAAQAMEKFYTERQTYVGATLGTSSNDVYPKTSPNNYYALDFSIAPTAGAYTLKASPAAGTSQINDKCGTFTLNQLGQKGNTGGTLSTTQCW